MKPVHPWVLLPSLHEDILTSGSPTCVHEASAPLGTPPCVHEAHVPWGSPLCLYDICAPAPRVHSSHHRQENTSLGAFFVISQCVGFSLQFYKPKKLKVIMFIYQLMGWILVGLGLGQPLKC